MSRRDDEQFEELIVEFFKLVILVTALLVVGAWLAGRWLCQACTWATVTSSRRLPDGAATEQQAAWLSVGWFAFFATAGLGLGWATGQPLVAVLVLGLGFVVARLVFVELGKERSKAAALSQPGALVLGGIKESWWGATRPYLVTQAERLTHITLEGPTGAGKSSAAVDFLIQDAWSGAGMTIIDPKGDLTSPFLSALGEHRVEDVVLVEPGDSSVVGLNPLHGIDPSLHTLTASELNSSMTALFGASFSRRQAHLLSLVLLGLLSTENATLLDIHRILVDEQFRKRVAFRCPNEMVRSSLLEFETTWSRADVQPLVWKAAGLFNTYPEARALFAEVEPRISIEEVVDSGKILIVNVPSGVVGEELADFICTLVAIRVRLACHRRAAIAADERRFHALHIDEASHVESGALTRLISESRSFNLGACLISQTNAFYSREIQTSMAVNVGTRLRAYISEGERRLEVSRLNGEEPLVFPHPGAMPAVDEARVARIRARSRELYASPVRAPKRLVIPAEEAPSALTATGEAAPRPRRSRPRRQTPQLTILEGGPDVVDEE